MSKLASVFICQQCGFRASRFLGRCPECGTWNSLVEEIEEISQKSKIKSQKLKKKPEMIHLQDLPADNFERISSGLSEFDRVLGGGIVPGSVVLVSGDPGIGKSTLLTQLALNQTNQTDNSDQSDSLYISGEESAHQIKLRADRIKIGADLVVLNEIDVDEIIEVIRGREEKRKKLRLVIIDSIQTLQTTDLASPTGSVGQVRECAHRLQLLAKSAHLPILLVGHITKEGSIAGPKTLEHLVDVVLSLEGDPVSQFRLLRSSKNRFGPTDEVGVFEMEEGGLVEVINPSKVFLETRVEAPGSAVVVTVSGARPILVEIQALVTKSFLPLPRRAGTGVDNNRLQLLVAVLTKRLGLPLFDKDIFINVTGGLKVWETAADLGIALAIISSLKDRVIDKKVVCMGEVGLLGELRYVKNLPKRQTEAKKLGFSRVISPDNAKTLAEAVRLALLK